jgi:3-deoxy-manno-octulosonate cytidylyltransferase (CMP-KDO synthetase)
VSSGYRIVVPARYASIRLPGKPLLPLAGKPMIQWVVERAQRSQATQVIVATDDERIAQAVRGFGAAVQMTARTHVSGTDRIAEVAQREGWSEADIVVNLQGDEPLMPVNLIDQVARLLDSYSSADIGTLSAPLESPSALQDPNVVKVVTDLRQRALYFSRAPIPYVREAPAGLEPARRHLGIYAYRVGALRRLAALAPSTLEQLEKLEQLRALENGMDIRVADAVTTAGGDVNTAADVAGVEALLRAGR